jgi:FtsH-binding integral membrane protein
MVNSSLYNRLFQPSSLIGGKAKNVNIFNILFQKKELLIMIFANLIVQFGITYYVFLKTNASKITGTNKVFIIIGVFALLIVIGLVPMPNWLKIILFCLFSYLQGLFLSSIKTVANQQMIQTAIVGAISVFALMFAFGLGLLTFGVALTSRFGLFLSVALLVLIIVQIVSIFAGTMPTAQKILAFISLIVFSIYVIYDTNRILQRNYYGDFITASMDYYLDILNIVLDILTLNTNPFNR